MKSIFSLCLIIFLSTILGCRNEMYDDSRYKPFEPIDYQGTQSSAYMPPINTIAWQEKKSAVEQSFEGSMESTRIVDNKQAILRGRESYNVFCSPCHDYVGSGNGMVVQRGYDKPPSFHTERLRKAPVKHFLTVMNSGFNAMPPYGALLSSEQQVQIAAYIQALQLSQHQLVSSLSAEQRAQFKMEDQDEHK